MLRKSFLIIIFFISGCSAVGNMDKILVLKGQASDSATQDKIVERQNKQFEQLMRFVQSGEIKEYSNKQMIQKKFGDPLFTQHLTEGDSIKDVWMYRYSVKAFDSPKVYLYFDQNDFLIEVKPENIPQNSQK